jgi:Short C-terminal domain
MLRRPMVGRRGPGLVGMAARTAVVAGTATATANAVNRREARRAQPQADDQAMYEQQAPPQGEPQAPSDSDDLTTKLGKLADLKASGALSDQEFAAAKAKLLGT